MSKKTFTFWSMATEEKHYGPVTHTVPVLARFFMRINRHDDTGFFSATVTLPEKLAMQLARKLREIDPESVIETETGELQVANAAPALA